MVLELDTIVDERNELRQRMAVAIRDCTKALRDRDEEIGEAQLLKQQHGKLQREQEHKMMQLRSELLKVSLMGRF